MAYINHVVSFLWEDKAFQKTVQQVFEKKMKADIQVFHHNLELAGRLLLGNILNWDRPQLNNADVIKYLKHAIQLNLEYQSVSADLTMALSKHLAALTQSQSDPKPSQQPHPKKTLTLPLAGHLGETVRAAFQVQNSWSVPIKTTFQLTPFMPTQGGQTVTSLARLEPTQLTLQPYQTRKATMVIPITPEFEPNQIYTAILSATGMDTLQVQVCLKVNAVGFY